MRFRYFDDKGRPVELDSVEALAARIRLGALREDMDLYDSVADRLAPAGEHDLFIRLKEESERAESSAETPSPLLGAVEPDSGDLAVQPGAGTGDVVEEAVEESFEERKLDLVEEEPAPTPDEAPEPEAIPGLEGAGDHLSDAWREESDGESEEDASASPPEGLESTALSETDEELAEDGNLDGLETLAEDGDSHRRTPSGAGSMPGWAATPPPAPPRGESGDAAEEEEESAAGPSRPLTPEEEADREFLARTDAEARKAAARARAEARGDGPARRRVRRARGGSGLPWGTIAAVAVVVAAGLGYLTLRGGNGESSRAQEAAPGTVTRTLATGEVVQAPDVDRTEAAALVVGIQAGLAGAFDLLDSLRVAYGVADGPPDQWLRGIYLAQASDFPQVTDYWNRHLEFVSAAEREVPLRFRSEAIRLFEERGMDPAEAASLYDEAGYWTLPQEEELRDMLDDLEDLSNAAVVLHQYLESVEDRIRYDPFGESTVPVDPVVEAIPLDEEVEDEMWDRIGRVADAFQASEAIRIGLPARVAERADSIRSQAGLLREN